MYVTFGVVFIGFFSNAITNKTFHSLSLRSRDVSMVKWIKCLFKYFIKLKSKIYNKPDKRSIKLNNLF